MNIRRGLLCIFVLSLLCAGLSQTVTANEYASTALSFCQQLTWGNIIGAKGLISPNEQQLVSYIDSTQEGVVVPGVCVEGTVISQNDDVHRVSMHLKEVYLAGGVHDVWFTIDVQGTPDAHFIVGTTLYGELAKARITALYNNYPVLFIVVVLAMLFWLCTVVISFLHKFSSWHAVVVLGGPLGAALWWLRYPRYGIVR